MKKQKKLKFEGVEKIVFKYPNVNNIITRGMSPSYIGTTAIIENGLLTWNSYTGTITNCEVVSQEGTTLTVVQNI